MGRDITLYPNNASKKDLQEYIEKLGFEKCGHLWDWPKGTLNYAWFEYEDFKSIDGVSADIYPVSGKELNITGNKWALHVRNLYSASYFDVKMLNDVLRGAKKEFGGTIHGDFGTNRYAPLWQDNSTPISRGVSAIYHHVEQELSSVKYALPDPIINLNPSQKEKVHSIIGYTNRLDPSRVIYNGLVPFAVSMFEYFFSQVFQVLIAYDHFALDKRKCYKLKVDFSTLLEVGGRGKTIENVIAENYTFQNLNQLNNAYKEWLDIDVRKILYRKRKIGNSIMFLENRISEIIQYRHGVVHHFSIDRTLTKKGYIHILEAIEKSMLELLHFIENKYNIKIDLN